jgi:hypothetical protein
MTIKLNVRFSEHIPVKEMDGMVSSIAAYGHVYPGETERDHIVEIFRPSKLPGLEHQLTQWDVHGFVRWSRRSPTEIP